MMKMINSGCRQGGRYFQQPISVQPKSEQMPFPQCI